MKRTLIQIIGVLCLLFGGVIGLGIIISLPSTITSLLIDYKNKLDIPYLIGNIIEFLIVFLISYLLIKYGLKWSSYNKKVKKIDEIDQIGKG